MPKQRLDTLLAERGLFTSRSRAAASVMAGEVLVGAGARRAEKPGEMVDPETEVTVREPPRFVSRGGIKLENALARTGIAVAGRHALDVGASTGGFTDCLLQRGAARVTAVDVGYGELDYRLRTDPRVRVLERTNARTLTPAMLAAPSALAGSAADGQPALPLARGAEGPPLESTAPREGAALQGGATPPPLESTAPREGAALQGGAIPPPLESTAPREGAALQGGATPDLAVIDVSFISLTKVLPAVLACLAEPYDVLALVKPQFEVGRERVGKGGVVRDPAARREALIAVGLAALRIDTTPSAARSIDATSSAARSSDTTPSPPAVLGFYSSGLPGPKGNRETFIWLAEPTRAGGAQSAADVEHMALREEPLACEPSGRRQVVREVGPDGTRAELGQPGGQL